MMAIAIRSLPKKTDVVLAPYFDDLAGNQGLYLQREAAGNLVVGAEDQHVDAFQPHQGDDFGRQPVVGDEMGNLQSGLQGAADQLFQCRFQPGRPGVLRLRGGLLLEDVDPRPDALRQGQGMMNAVEVPAGGGQRHENFFTEHGGPSPKPIRLRPHALSIGVPMV